MRQVIHIVRKVEMDRERKHFLELDLDYFLATLHDALNRNDVEEIEGIKRKLTDITNELKELTV